MSERKADSEPRREGNTARKQGGGADALEWFLGGVRPLHVVIIAGIVWLLRNSSPIVVEVKLPSHGASTQQSTPPTPVPEQPQRPGVFRADSDPMQRRYTYADYLTLLSVDPIYETVVDPLIASTLLNHDVKKDKAYADNPEDNENKAKMYGPFLSRGFKEDERLYIAWTGPERGFGAFASVGIPTGTPIGIYAGVVTNQSVGSRYSWHYNSDHEIQNEEGATIGLSLDAWHRGNHLRFVNHDEYPNCNVEMVAWNNLWHVLYVTNRAIKPGEEVTVSYGSGYWSGRQQELKVGYTEGYEEAAQAAAQQQQQVPADGTVTVIETVVAE